MGAGKTTFIHALCDFLGVEDAVSSPTFALINEYYFSAKAGKEQKIYHMDWYRLRSTEEAINAGVEDQVNDTSAYTFIEWPEKAKELLPKKHLWISITETAPGERLMEVFANE